MTDKVQEIMALPPLPEPFICNFVHAGQVAHLFTRGQLQAYAKAAIESRLREVVAPPVPEPLTDSYVQRVPDKCDRIVWRNNYYHLPLAPTEATHTQPASEHDDYDISPYFGQSAQPASEPVASSATLGDALEAWKALKESCDPAEWATDESATYRGFFMHGWHSRGHAATPQPASEPVARADALNTLCKMLHNGEEVEGDDGLAMLVPMDLWNEAQEAIESLVGEDDATPQPAAKQAEPHPFTPTEVVNQKPGFVSHKAEPVARDGWKILPLSAEILHLDEEMFQAVLTEIRANVRAALAASPTQPRPQPLTEIEVAVGWKDSVTCTASLGSRAQAFEEGVRFAEKHFGITAQEPTE
jgi:hypothetical protein